MTGSAAVARKNLMADSRENGTWIVVTEADGSRVAYSACETLPGTVWVMWHEWGNCGHTVSERIVTRSIISRHPDVELMDEPPEECEPDCRVVR